MKQPGIRHVLSTRSLRFQLVLAVNSVLIVLLVGLVIVDYQRALKTRLAEKKTALQEEAKALLPGIVHLRPHGRESIQSYIDDVCGRMEDMDSPNHHIAVKINGEVIQAQAHHRASAALVELMQRAANAKEREFRRNGQDLVVGAMSNGNVTILVSEGRFAVEGHRAGRRTASHVWASVNGVGRCLDRQLCAHANCEPPFEDTGRQNAGRG